MSDLSLRQDVERELGCEPMLRPAEIGVAVRDGVVTLSGDVSSSEAKSAAERAVARVRGVRAISSQLEVRPPGLPDRSDADIAWAAANVLAWNALFPADRIHIKVSRGWVTLEGSVDWRFQKTAAADAVADLAGVEGVSNMITVAPAVPASEVKQEVEQALLRVSKAAARRIIVETDGDCVRLWGLVDTPEQRQAVERAAWSAPGVRDVSNHVTVQRAACVAAT